MLMFIIIILLTILLFPFFRRPPYKEVLNIYFGVPGSGKTTWAAYLTRCCQKRRKSKRITVVSNVPITGAMKLDAKADIGVVDISNCKLIIDEAGVEFNNRNFKSFSADAIYFFKYHRHYHVSVDVFSQSFEDMDITIRRLAQNYFVVKRSLIPYCIVCRKIRRSVGIDDNTHQIIDAYKFGVPVLDTYRVFSPFLWRLFNSYSHKVLPAKDWQAW